MPIQDAIDLARFLVETTIGFVRFAVFLPKSVGGAVEIAASNVRSAACHSQRPSPQWLARRSRPARRRSVKAEEREPMRVSPATRAGVLEEAEPRVPTSVVLERLIQDAPAGYVTLGWLIGHLRTRSFGIILLLLGVCGLLPVVSPIAGLMLAIPAFQMIRAHPAPIFPQRVAERPVATDKIAAMLRRIIPVLRYLERFIRPRWSTPFEATKRVIGGVVLILGVCLLAPLPLSNLPVGLTIVLLAFAYLEEDGVLLGLALALALGLFGIGATALWSVVAAAVWLAR
jgi:hypothetical protein